MAPQNIKKPILVLLSFAVFFRSRVGLRQVSTGMVAVKSVPHISGQGAAEAGPELDCSDGHDMIVLALVLLTSINIY